jgi:hypothetical protein
LVALALIGTVVWFARNAPDEGVAMIGDNPKTSPSGAPRRNDALSAAGDPVRMSDTPSSTPMPPKNTWLDELWATLLGPAQSGESQAACRLAFETIRCEHYIRMFQIGVTPRSQVRGELQALVALERSPEFFMAIPRDARAATPSAGDHVFERFRPGLQRCGGYSAERAATAHGLLRAAALAGEPDAQALYASGEGWFMVMPGGLGGPVYEQWVREAPLVVARMLDAGHPDAPALLAGAYGGQSWLAGLYPRDAERAAAFLILNTRLMQRPEIANDWLRGMAPAQRARAAAMAEELYRRHYEGRAMRPARLFWGSEARIAEPDMTGADNVPVPCERAPAAP